MSAPERETASITLSSLSEIIPGPNNTDLKSIVPVAVQCGAGVVD